MLRSKEVESVSSTSSDVGTREGDVDCTNRGERRREGGGVVEFKAARRDDRRRG